MTLRLSVPRTADQGRNAMESASSLPGWLKPANRVVMALQGLGLAIGTMRVLSVPGRTSGKMRSTPVSPLTVNGQRYIIGGFAQGDWVRTARVAGWATRSGRRRASAAGRAALEERAPILREFHASCHIACSFPAGLWVAKGSQVAPGRFRGFGQPVHGISRRSRAMTIRSLIA
jgi:hypothetical protein